MLALVLLAHNCWLLTFRELLDRIQHVRLWAVAVSLLLRTCTNAGRVLSIRRPWHGVTAEAVDGNWTGPLCQGWVRCWPLAMCHASEQNTSKTTQRPKLHPGTDMKRLPSCVWCCGSFLVIAATAWSASSGRHVAHDRRRRSRHAGSAAGRAYPVAQE